MNIGFDQIAALLSALFWATGIVLLKKGETGSATIRNLYRHIIAALFFGIILSLYCREWIPPNLNCWIILILSSFFGIVLSETFFLKSLELVGVGRTTIIGTLYAPSVVLFSFLFLTEKVSLSELVGSGLVFIAASLVLQKGRGHFTGKGVLFALLSVLFNAMGTVTLKPLLTRLPILEIIALRLILSIPVLLIIIQFKNGWIQINFWTHFRNYLGRITVLGILLADGLATLLWFVAMREGTVAMTTILGQFAPILALVLSALILKEKLPEVAKIAFALSIAGGTIILLN